MASLINQSLSEIEVILVNDVSTDGSGKFVMKSYSNLKEILASEDGYLQAVHADDIGIAAMVLSAGREKITDTIDMGAGIYFYKKIGDYLEKVM